mgnify:CR=1 FL=1
MKVGIIGCRGIPNHHGGFEQFAEYFSVYLADKGVDITVYNSSLHPYKENEYQGVKIITCSDPEDKLGTAGQFIYDLNCIKDARNRNFDVILQLGYTSSSIWYKLLPKDAVIVTNMDGLEWKRSKYSKLVKSFLRFAEKLAVRSSDFLISDSIGIQQYLKRAYRIDSKYIAYGALPYKVKINENTLKEFKVKENAYFLLIARVEPENNIELILDGYVQSNSEYTFLVIGNVEQTKFGQYLIDKYKAKRNIVFVGPEYDITKLNYLRYSSRLYFHGHSVGGTNPSLLEAMASQALIAAHDNEFNSAILGEDSFYFNSKSDVSQLIKQVNKANYLNKVENNLQKIKNNFSWEIINKQYLDFLETCYANKD